jgi:hypothetical protein
MIVSSSLLFPWYDELIILMFNLVSGIDVIKCLLMCDLIELG